MSPAPSGPPPSEPVRGGGAAGERPSAPAERPPGSEPRAGEEHERFGPLELTRIHKDDGRELIFFADARQTA